MLACVVAVLAELEALDAEEAALVALVDALEADVEAAEALAAALVSAVSAAFSEAKAAVEERIGVNEAQMMWKVTKALQEAMERIEIAQSQRRIYFWCRRRCAHGDREQ